MVTVCVYIDESNIYRGFPCLILNLHHDPDDASVLQKYPGKFIGCCLADPTEGGGGLKEMERLIQKVRNLALVKLDCLHVDC